jgi:flagellin-like protein
MSGKRRGVSPVIATLLLIVIAVAAAVLAYIWITGYMGTLQAQAGAQQVQERIKIEGVQVNENNDQISAIYVRNIGDVTATIADVYLLDSSGNVLGSSTTTATVSPESSSTISAPATTLTPGHTYIVKIVTTRGTEATYQFTYRKSKA